MIDDTILNKTNNNFARHNYFHHSNHKSKTRDYIFFDKCYLRPKVNQAWNVVRNQSETKNNIDQAWEVINRLDTKRNESLNANMFFGRIVQDITDLVLLHEYKLQEALDKVAPKVAAYKPRSWDSKDKIKFDQYIGEYKDVARFALEGLKQALHKDNRIIGETEYLHLISNKLDLPYNTLPDYGRRGDLKTKWSSHSPSTKSGWRSPSLPYKGLTHEFELSTLYQLVGFWACNKQQPPFVVYASKNDCIVLTEKNCEQLQTTHLQNILKKIIRFHKSTETLLKTAKTTVELLQMVSPDFDKLCWNVPPTVLEEAEKIWTI